MDYVLQQCEEVRGIVYRLLGQGGVIRRGDPPPHVLSACFCVLLFRDAVDYRLPCTLIPLAGLAAQKDVRNCGCSSNRSST